MQKRGFLIFVLAFCFVAFAGEDMSLQEQVDFLELKVSSLEEELQVARDKCQTMEVNYNWLTKEYRQLKAKLETENSYLTKKLKDAKSELEHWRGKTSDGLTKMGKKEKLIIEFKAALQKSDEKISNLKKQLVQLITERDQFAMDKIALVKELEDLKKVTVAQSAEVASKGTCLTDMDQKVAELQEKVQALEKELELEKAKTKGLAELESKITFLKKNLEEGQDVIRHLTEEKKNLDKEIKKRDKKTEEVSEEAEKYKAKLHVAQSQSREKDKKIESLEKSLKATEQIQDESLAFAKETLNFSKKVASLLHIDLGPQYQEFQAAYMVFRNHLFHHQKDYRRYLYVIEVAKRSGGMSNVSWTACKNLTAKVSKQLEKMLELMGLNKFTAQNHLWQLAQIFDTSEETMQIILESL